jgi:hypothetical protein
MNPAFRLLMLSVVTGVVASALTPAASGRQTGRRGAGNSAEVERLERERRDREMREADLRERQLLLRNMKPDARPAERPAPRLATAQIREDFVRLQVLNNDLAKAGSRVDALDLKFVSKSAAEIRRLAARLRDNLALPGAGDAPEQPGVKAAPPAQLGPALAALDGLILKFADGLASKGVYLVDAQSSAKARRELEAIIELSGWVKKASERLERSRPRPRRGP